MYTIFWAKNRGHHARLKENEHFILLSSLAWGNFLSFCTCTRAQLRANDAKIVRCRDVNAMLRNHSSNVKLLVVVESLTLLFVPRVTNNIVEIRPSYLSRVFHHFRDPSKKPVLQSWIRCIFNTLFIQEKRPGFRFRLSFFFFVQSQIAVVISRAMKSHTNEHTVRGRPTPKVV